MDNVLLLHRQLLAEATGPRADATLAATAVLAPVLRPFRAARDLVVDLTSTDPDRRNPLLGPVLSLYQSTMARLWATLLTIAFWRGILGLRKAIAEPRWRREERMALILETFYETAASAQSPAHLWLDTRKRVFRALAHERFEEDAHHEVAEAALAFGLVDVVAHAHDRGEPPADDGLEELVRIRDALLAAGVGGRDAEAIARLEALGESARDTVALFYPDASPEEKERLAHALKKARTRVRRMLVSNAALQLGLPGVPGRSIFADRVDAASNPSETRSLSTPSAEGAAR